jgi:hypothetical protein
VWVCTPFRESGPV